jgi:hypothetical protein
MKLPHIALACLAAASFSAQAADPTFTTGGTALLNQGQVSSVDHAATVDFNPGWLSSTADYSYTNFTITQAPGNSGYSAEPPGDATDFFSVGTAPQHVSTTATLTFGGAGASYFGMYLGSPDGYNSITFTGNGVNKTFSGSDLAGAWADGNQGTGLYINFFAAQGTSFTTVTFNSGTNAFETDNHAYLMAAAVPEPETYAMMLAGLALVGLARRRKA